MKYFNWIYKKNKKTYLSLLIAPISLGLLAKYCYSYLIMNNEAKKIKSLYVYGILLHIIRSNKKIIELVGEDINFKERSIDVYEYNDTTISFLSKASGFKGNCNIHIKLNKVDHDLLTKNNDIQQKYSLLNSYNKIKSLFFPIDYNSIILPTNETIDKYKSKTSFLSEYIDNLLNNNTNKYIYNKDINLKFQTVSKEKTNKLFELEPSDTFWIIANINIDFNEYLKFDIYPVLKSERKYNVEDTYYNYNSIVDYLNNINSFYDDYYVSDVEKSKKSYTYSRNDLLIKKNQMLQDTFTNRKIMYLFNIFTILITLVFKKRYNQSKLIFNKFDNIKAILNKNSKLIQDLGKEYCISFTSYNYNILNNKYEVFLYAYGCNKYALVKFDLNYSDTTNDFIIQNININLANNEKDTNNIKLNNNFSNSESIEKNFILNKNDIKKSYELIQH